MIASIELQVISRILTSDNSEEVEALLALDKTYYSVFQEQINFILGHYYRYNDVPDVFTFQSEFPDVRLVQVNEPLSYLLEEMNKNKQHILLLETFNKIKDLGAGDVSAAWEYLELQCDRAHQLDASAPLDLVKDAIERSEQVVEFSRQTRIPTGFAEIDKLMYGGLSTVEELLLIFARTNTGKSWVCTKMMETAQKHGFPVLYYSPEMQGSFLGTRFDTWRGHFQNSQLYQGKYTDAYLDYLKSLQQEETSAYIVEDKDLPGGVATVANLERLVKKLGIKELIIDGLSYMSATAKYDSDYLRYKNLCDDLFRLSKKYGCAVIVVMQANRETKNIKDDKGDAMPTLYEIEGSDHPGRIATQAFSLRQVFDRHVLDIRLEKSRMANNQKPIFSYAWDVNTGNCQYLPSEDDDDPIQQSITPKVTPSIMQHEESGPPSADVIGDDDFEEDVEF